MSHPVVYTRAPDKILYEADLFDQSWEAKAINAFGDQPTFDLLADGHDDRGLRITLLRGDGRNGANGNGYTVDTTEGSLASGSIDDAARVVEIGIPLGSILSAVKLEVDGANYLSGVYFGGENGSSTSGRNEGAFAGGTPDLPAWYEVHPEATTAAYIATGTSAPTDATAELASRFLPHGRFLPAGHRIWTHRSGSNDLRGSIALWIARPGTF